MAYMNWGDSFWSGAQKGYDFVDKAEEAFATRQISKAIEEQEKKRQEELDLINGRLYYDRETGQLMKVPYQGAGPQAPQAPQTAGEATQTSPQQAINPNSMVVDINGTNPRHQLTPSERQQYQEQLNRDYDAAIRQKYAQYGRADQAAAFLQNRRGDDRGQLEHQAMQRAQTIIDAWKPDDKGNFELMENPETREQALALMNGAKDMLSYVIPGLNKDADIVYRNGKLGVVSKGKFKPMNAGAARMCMAMGAGLAAYNATGDPSLLSGGFAIGKEMAEGVERQDRMAVMKAKAGVRQVGEGGGGSGEGGSGGSDKKTEAKNSPPKSAIKPKNKPTSDDDRVQAYVDQGYPRAAAKLRVMAENRKSSGRSAGSDQAINQATNPTGISDYTPRLGNSATQTQQSSSVTKPNNIRRRSRYYSSGKGIDTTPASEKMSTPQKETKTTNNNSGRGVNKASLSTGKKARNDAIGDIIKQRTKK